MQEVNDDCCNFVTEVFLSLRGFENSTCEQLTDLGIDLDGCHDTQVTQQKNNNNKKMYIPEL